MYLFLCLANFQNLTRNIPCQVLIGYQKVFPPRSVLYIFEIEVFGSFSHRPAIYKLS